MKSWRQTPMDYFVVEFDAGPGKSFGDQIAFCESSEQKAEETAKAWALSRQIRSEPKISKMESCVFSSGRFYEKPRLADEKNREMLSQALSSVNKKSETSTNPVKGLGATKQSRK
jgi:predicted house-cleaning NTP pyrophosphatase (Maf/HAM1 superfamily)